MGTVCFFLTPKLTHSPFQLLVALSSSTNCRQQSPLSSTKVRNVWTIHITTAQHATLFNPKLRGLYGSIEEAMNSKNTTY